MASDLRDDRILKEVPEAGGFKILTPCVIYAKVGEGGMGAVYRGKHLKFDIDVGIKCLLPAVSGGGEELVLRFEREAKLAAQVNHQNLVRVYEVDHRHGVHYLVMEYVSGETARERVRRKGALEAGEAVAIILGAARGLAAAHAKNIVHRDVKPDNILISADGQVKLADLGLGRMQDEQGAPEEKRGGVSDVTRSSTLMGTPRYMPPEQWEGLNRVGPEGDVWAMGATLYFLVAGHDPFEGSTQTEIVRRICLEPFPDVEKEVPTLLPDLALLIRKCTEREPQRRFADAGKLVAALEDLAAKHALAGSLHDPAAGTGTSRCALVSPPPRELLARLKLALATKTAPAGAPGSETATRSQDASDPDHTLSREEAERAERAAAAAGTAPTAAAAVPPGVGRRPAARWLAAAGILLFLVAGAFVAHRLATRPARDQARGAGGARHRRAQLELPAARPRPGASIEEILKEASRSLERPESIEDGVGLLEEALAREPARGETRGKLAAALRSLARSDREGKRVGRAMKAALRSRQLEESTAAGEVLAEMTGAIREAMLGGIAVERPVAGAVVPAPDIVVSGALGYQETAISSLKINGAAAEVLGGRFEAAVRGLAEGENVLEIEAQEENGIAVSKEMRVTVDTRPPELTVEQPEPDSWVRASVRLRGQVRDVSLAGVVVDGKPAAADGGTWEAVLTLPEGTHKAVVKATDAVGRETVVERSFRVDATAPAVAIEAPKEPATPVAKETIEVSVRVADRGEVKAVEIAGAPAAPAGAGLYARTVPLPAEGANVVDIDAVDAAGNRTGARLTVVRDTKDPEVSITTPREDEEVPAGPLRVEGKVVDAGGGCRVEVNGTAAAVTGEAWAAEVRVDAGVRELRATSVDAAGNADAFAVRAIKVAGYRLLPGFRGTSRNEQGLDEYRHETTGIIMVLLPGGEFLMGSDAGEAGSEADERPRHPVTLDPFLIAKQEVSQAEWEKLMGTNPSRTARPDLPAESVHWDDCRQFCARAKLSLPSEAEWEYACRGGATTAYAFGEALRPEQANFEGKATVPVASFAPNGFGLHNLHGNVWEWCADIYAADFYAKPEARARNPESLAGSTSGVMRGGSWGSPATNCRAANRERIDRSSRFANLGFRPVFRLPRPGETAR